MILHKHDADFTIPDQDGRTPLDISKENKHEACYQFISGIYRIQEIIHKRNASNGSNISITVTSPHKTKHGKSRSFNDMKIDIDDEGESSDESSDTSTMSDDHEGRMAFYGNNRHNTPRNAANDTDSDDDFDDDYVEELNISYDDDDDNDDADDDDIDDDDDDDNNDANSNYNDDSSEDEIEFQEPYKNGLFSVKSKSKSATLPGVDETSPTLSPALRDFHNRTNIINYSGNESTTNNDDDIKININPDKSDIKPKKTHKKQSSWFRK